MKKYQLLTAAISGLAAGSAQADLTIRFIEGAPKDRFVIENTGCAMGPVEIALDLRNSRGGLIFDTTANGAGVEVFQPVEVTQGADQLIGMTATGDGDQVLRLSLSGLMVKAPITLTTDLDDTAPQSALGQIRVTGAEIAGGTVTVAGSGVEASGQFDDNARATLAVAGCTS